ncbi:MAG: hypothetical protein OXN16_15060 [Gammaproteobacteria bacterium]|nr:hypothetical protein [Gammaproteobacteria bacterium]MDE0282369.1 hypothetical protein [Gammaproteobacteria bacterium]
MTTTGQSGLSDHDWWYARWRLTGEVVRLAERQPENPNLTTIITAHDRQWLAVSTDLVPMAACELH